MKESNDFFPILFVAMQGLICILGVVALLWTLFDILPFPSALAAEDPALEERFYAPEGRDGVGTVIVDRETGVCYLWRKEGYGAGMTLLVDAEGDPLLWEDSDD